jgi:hypothetical protein
LNRFVGAASHHSRNGEMTSLRESEIYDPLVAVGHQKQFDALSVNVMSN